MGKGLLARDKATYLAYSVDSQGTRSTTNLHILCRRQLLLKWKTVAGPEATYENLIKALVEVRDLRCANFIVKLWDGKFELVALSLVNTTCTVGLLSLRNL